jgi:hypothetical protein
MNEYLPTLKRHIASVIIVALFIIALAVDAAINH